ncbi:type IV secretion system DNA-binding domain-containing protein [uncultured Clostridium sp.]|uniref:type IV secretory system conjugative DNA transfer family protein n=1 Tax=uncultured Clostridium sp. TaxID=59620 RepID=UPI0028E83B81|nr:TraM recognition domain-containing protein [uncultured Clostridium sp.]
MEILKKRIESCVDKTDAKIIDRISIILFIILSAVTIYFFCSTFRIVSNPILVVHSKVVYTLVLFTDIMLFYLTMLGDKTSKPVNRPKIFLLISIILGISIYSMLAEIFNQAFINFLGSLIGIESVPSYLLISNIRIMSIYVPLFASILILYDSFKIPLVEESKKELLEYSLDILTRNIYEISEKTINLKIAEDIESGGDIILSEGASKQHTLIAGSSGSGKTALVLRPIIDQLCRIKAEFRDNLKKLVFKCLENDICYLKGPLTERYINNNFSMDLIGIKEGKKEEFLEIFKNYIIGIRESSTILFNKVVQDGELTIPLNAIKDVKKREINIIVYEHGLEYEEYKFEYKNGLISGENVNDDDYSISIQVKSNAKSEVQEEESLNDLNEEDEEKKIDIEVCETGEELLYINLKAVKGNEGRFTFKVNVTQHNEGKIIYRNLGFTVVAPDGGLPDGTMKMANEYGVKVHKIDPKMEEINKGHIAKFNPMMVGTPEKAADVISSILVKMLETNGNDSNPYYINASIRAIRNLVILLRITFPKISDKNPTLLNVLDLLNDMNSVEEYVKVLQADSRLEQRYKRVIDYFVSSFYPQPKDDKGTLSFKTKEGVNRKKTQEAISGIQNQLDNLLGREELRYILCDPDDGMNLSDILEKGECLAIATRQSELGEILGKAFALMFILSMQNAVLCRYSEDENPEIPHYMIIDELPFYINEGLEVFFTFSRKYKCSLICAIQNIAQLFKESEAFKQIIFSNTDTKLILPGSNVEDRKYYSEMLGTEFKFETQTGISQNPILTENANYSETTKGSMKEANKVSTQEIGELEFKRCYYVYTNSKGKKRIGKGFIDFIKNDKSKLIKIEYLPFSRFTSNTNNNVDEVKEVVNGDSHERQASSEDHVNLYNNIQEIDIDTLEFDAFESDNISEEKIIETEEIKDSNVVNFLEKKLLKSTEDCEESIKNKEKEKDKVVENDNENINNTNDKYNIDNINIDKLNIEGIEQK